MSNEPTNNFPNGHLQMRNGILDHLVDGKMTPDMFTAYYLMLARCNFATGVWHGSAERLVAETGGVWSLRTAQRVLERLLDGGYISSTHKRGKRGNYDILISNYVPTIGEHRGKKLRPRTVDQLETSSDSTVTTKSDATGDAASESSDKSDDTSGECSRRCSRNRGARKQQQQQQPRCCRCPSIRFARNPTPTPAPACHST